MPIDIGKKIYKLVAERLQLFWERYPDLHIETDAEPFADGVIMRACIVSNDDGYATKSIGHAYAEISNDAFKALEKAESCAVGRALAFLHKDLMGSEIASADEIAGYLAEQINYMALVREHWLSIHAAKEFLLPTWGENEDQPNVSAARECLKELGEDVYRALWKAPSKGGVFTTHERTILKTKPEGSL